MTVYYYPNPTAQPLSTNFNYSVGDYYINQNGSIVKSAAGTGLSAGKLLWAKATGIVPTVLVPGITTTITAASLTINRNQSVNSIVMSARGGAAIIPTGGTSIAAPGTTPVFNITISPALPAGLSLATVKTSPTIVNPDGTSNIYNNVQVSLTGTPTTFQSATSYTISFTDAAGNVGSGNFSLTILSGVSTPTATTLVNSTSALVNFAVTAFTPVSGTGGSAPLTYSVSPDLPAGLSLNSTTGQITGTPTEARTATYTITVTDTLNQTASATFNLTVTAPVAINVVQAVPSTVLTQNTAISTFTPVTATGGQGALAYSISPSLPSGVTFSTTTGAITGTPSGISAVTTYTVTVTDTIGQTASRTFELSVVYPSIVTVQAVSSKSLTKNVAATSFTPVTATGGIIPLVYAISPSLPSGLSFNTTTGAITGTASATIASTIYTVTVTDSVSQTSSKTFNLTVNDPPELTTTLAVASYAATQSTAIVAFTPVTVSGGVTPLVWSITPALPTGVTFNTTNGQISGTPSNISGTTAYTITVNDSAFQTSSQVFNFTVNAGPIVLTQNVAGRVLTQYIATASFTPISASGGFGTLAYAISPSLPTGLSFNTTTGAITGTATVTLAQATYTVTVTDSIPQSTSKTFTLTVNSPPAIVTNIAVSTTTFVLNRVGQTSTPITASGGYGALRYAVVPSLSAGLAYNTGTGAISGTPTAISPISSYVVTVSDTLSQQSTQSFKLEVIYPPLLTTLAVPNTRLVQFTTATTFVPVTASGGQGTYTYAISPGLPNNLLFSTTTGAVSGFPIVGSSTASYTVSVTDFVGQTSNKVFGLFVALAPTPPAITATVLLSSISLTKNQSSVSYSPVSATGGQGILTYAIAPPLPTGLTFLTQTGQILGSPTTTSTTATFTVTVTDQVFQSVQRNFDLGVSEPEPLVTTTTIAVTTLDQNVAASFIPVTATGGYGTLAYAVSPNLPNGLTYSGSTGRVSGTPTSYSFTATYSVTVSDQATQRSTQTFVLNVIPPAFTATLAISAFTAVRSVAVTTFTPVTVTGGHGGNVFTITPPLPAGLLFSSSTGAISGTPSVVSSSTFYAVSVTDNQGQTAGQSFNLAVNSPPALATTQLVSSVNLIRLVTTASVSPVGATGGYGNIIFSVNPALPNGLSFAANNGKITGIATVLASGTYTVSATDSIGQTSSSPFNLTVSNPPLTATTTVTNISLI